MRGFISFADHLSTSVGKAFSWCIVILMGGTCYEVVMAYAFNAPTLWNFDFSLTNVWCNIHDGWSLYAFY